MHSTAAYFPEQNAENTVVVNMKWPFYLSLCFLLSCSLLQNNAVLHQAAQTMPDSIFVYRLPYQNGTSQWVVQGCYSVLSHHGDFAIDFKMKPGTGVHAARSGRVLFVRSHNTKGGIGKRFLGQGNGITIRHNDGTFAHYWHLQHNGSLVGVGDTVVQGQLIGRSGNTGFSAFPHLHFEVTRQPRIGRKEVPVLFYTRNGAKFLQPLRRYKAP